MKKYKVYVTEKVYYRMNGVEAESQYEAEEKVRAMWDAGKLNEQKDCELDIDAEEEE